MHITNEIFNFLLIKSLFFIVFFSSNDEYCTHFFCFSEIEISLSETKFSTEKDETKWKKAFYASEWPMKNELKKIKQNEMKKIILKTIAVTFYYDVNDERGLRVREETFKAITRVCQ